MRKYILIFSLIIMLMGFTAFFMLRKKAKTVSFGSFPVSNNYLSLYQEEEEITFEIFFNRTDSLMTDTKAVSAAWITDSEKENLLTLKLQEIKKTGNKIIKNEETYYSYLFTFTTEMLVEEDFEFLIPEAYLSLLYRGDKEIMIPVGSFAFKKISAFGSDELFISRLQGIVNEIDGIKTLVGVCLSLKNKSDSEVTVKSIESLAVFLHPSPKEIVYLDNATIDSGISINSLIKDYDPYKIEEGEAEIEIAPDSELRFLLPLKYEKLLFTNTLPLQIEYEVNGSTKKYYFNEFTFFTDYRYSQERINTLQLQTDENY